MRKSLVLLVGLALLACAPSPEDASAAAAQEVVEQYRSFEGQYVVTYVNEAAPEIGIEGSEPTVTVSAGRIHFQSQCIYRDWSYSRNGTEIETGRYTYPETGGLVGMCARGFMPGEEAIIAALSEAKEVRFVPHGLWFSGEKGTVQMRRVPSAEELASRAVDLTGEWRVLSLDGKALEEGDAIALSADWSGIWWEPGCAGQGVMYRIEGNAFVSPPPLPQGMVCDIGFSPTLPKIWEAMRASDRIEQRADGQVLISGGGRSLVLESIS